MTGDSMDALREAGLKRLGLLERLAAQDEYVTDRMRAARAEGHTWVEIGKAAGMSHVAAMKRVGHANG